MAGVVRAIRRTLMSGTALVRGGLVSLAGIAAARADDGELRAVETFLNLTQQEIAALAIAAGVLTLFVPSQAPWVIRRPPRSACPKGCSQRAPPSPPAVPAAPAAPAAPPIRAARSGWSGTRRCQG